MTKHTPITKLVTIYHNGYDFLFLQMLRFWAISPLNCVVFFVNAKILGATLLTKSAALCTEGLYEWNVYIYLPPLQKRKIVAKVRCMDEKTFEPFLKKK